MSCWLISGVVAALLIAAALTVGTLLGELLWQLTKALRLQRFMPWIVFPPIVAGLAIALHESGGICK